MRAPTFLELVVLALASYRTWRLIGRDTILDRPRRWLLRVGDWRDEGDPIPDDYREHWHLFLTCPWCAGFWHAVAWWVAWSVDVALLGSSSAAWVLWAALPWALSALVGLVVMTLDPDDE